MSPLDFFKGHLALFKGLALVAAVVGLLMTGWTARGWKEDAGRLKDERQAHEAYIKTTNDWAEVVQWINGQRDQERQQAVDDRREFDRRVNDAKRDQQMVVCGNGVGPGAATEPGGSVVRFSPAFTGLWNDGLAIGLPAALRAGRSDGPSAGADPLEAEDLLDNVAANGEACNELRGRLLAVQAWARSIGAMK